MVGILISFWDGLFSGAMLVSGSVSPEKNQGQLLSMKELGERSSFFHPQMSISEEHAVFFVCAFVSTKSQGAYDL